MTGAEAKELANRLDLNVHDLPICLACLSFVSLASARLELVRTANRVK